MISDLLPEIGDGDSVGRRVFSESRARKARRGTAIPHDVFLERDGVSELSVDRMDHCSDHHLAIIAKAEGAPRGKEFYGWATVNVSPAARDGRAVSASPTPANPFHATIDLNISPQHQAFREAQKLHAAALATLATWRESPNGSS